MESTTTLVCLFHHEQQAQAALADLRKAGIAESSTSILGGDGASVDALDKSELASLGMPDRDYDHLKDGIREGGVIVAVSARGDQVGAVESIFGSHRAEKIDDVEKSRRDEPVAAVVPSVVQASPFVAEPLPPVKDDRADDGVIPVIEENLVVGKRTVDEGGVRLYRRIVQVPVEQDVTLREEHVNVNRVAVDRPVSDADQLFKNRTIELTETAEEAVVAKTARVVEEVVVNKGVTEHTETVRDTVRHTEVEVDELPAVNTVTSTTTPGRSTN